MLRPLQIRTAFGGAARRGAAPVFHFFFTADCSRAAYHDARAIILRRPCDKFETPPGFIAAPAYSMFGSCRVAGSRRAKRWRVECFPSFKGKFYFRSATTLNFIQSSVRKGRIAAPHHA
jgi:hypothetical protein